MRLSHCQCLWSVCLAMCVRADDDSDVCNDIIRFCDRTSDKECARVCVRACVCALNQEGKLRNSSKT